MHAVTLATLVAQALRMNLSFKEINNFLVAEGLRIPPYQVQQEIYLQSQL